MPLRDADEVVGIARAALGARAEQDGEEPPGALMFGAVVVRGCARLVAVHSLLSFFCGPGPGGLAHPRGHFFI